MVDIAIVLSVSLATIAATATFIESGGPFGVMEWLRNKTERFGLLQCELCTSFWVAGGLVWAFTPQYGVLGWLGIWGASYVVIHLMNIWEVK